MSEFKKNTDWQVLTPNGWSDFEGIKKLQTDCYITIIFDDDSIFECSPGHQIEMDTGKFSCAVDLGIGEITSTGMVIKELIFNDEKTDLYDLINVELDEKYISDNVVSHNCAFIPEIENIWGSAQQTLATGGRSIVLSTPNGVSNWFHKQWVDAKEGRNEFVPIQLHWKMHPERDQAWRDKQDLILGNRLAMQECFDCNTRIYTANGLKKICDIKIGDKVLTHTGKFKNVIKLYSHLSNTTSLIYSYNNRNKRHVTINHPFLSIDDSWIELKNISDGQILKSFPLNIEYDWNENVSILDLYNNFVPKNFKKVLNSDDTFYVNDRKHKTIHKRYVQVNYDVGYIIGLYLAEGSKSRLRTVFSFNYDTELHGWPVKVQQIIQQTFGLKNYTIRYKGNNTGDLEISSEVLSSFIDLFVSGNRCYNKKLSHFTYSFNNKEFYSGILDGMFRGDGCLTNTSNKKILITSLNLIYDMKYISSMLGYNLSSLRTTDKEYKVEYSKKGKWKDKNYNYHDTFILTFYNTKNIHITSEFTKNVLESYDEYSYKNSIFKSSDSINSKIYIEDCDDEILVYNLEVEDDNSYVTEHFIVHNCDADFLSSGNTVIDVDTLRFYKETFIKPPIEKRGFNKDLWIWSVADYSKTYMVSADVSRGDGSDYSAAHVIDVETLEQVAEFKGLLSTKDFGNFLVGLATEYNDALLVIENASVGWATIQQVIDRNYINLYYTDQNIKYIDERVYLNKGGFGQPNKKSVPGFTTSAATRPLIINKMEQYFRDRSILLYSERTLNELYAFVWNGQRVEAMKGYNDDLCMSLAIGLWVRDTALQVRKMSIESTKFNIDSFTVVRPDSMQLGVNDSPYNQWNMEVGPDGESEDISKWLL